MLGKRELIGQTDDVYHGGERSPCDSFEADPSPAGVVAYFARPSKRLPFYCRPPK